jgi:hypothetical protein
VIGLHALGAITHHVVFRDRTLRRMLWHAAIQAGGGCMISGVVQLRQFAS